MWLERLNLGRYVESFAELQVDGAMLDDLDDVILSVDLGVSIKLHRIKIIKSIKDLFDGSKAEAQPPLPRADSRLLSQIEATGMQIY